MLRAVPAIALLAVTALIAGCHKPREQQARDDARDIALVEQAQHAQPPIVAVTPEPVSFADLDTPGLTVKVPHDMKRPRAGEGCSFGAAGASTPVPPPIMVAVPKLGLMKIGGQLEFFASDSGSKALPGGLHVKYTSGARTMVLSAGDVVPGPGAGSGGAWRASLTLRDQLDRIAYFSAGVLTCAKPS